LKKAANTKKFSPKMEIINRVIISVLFLFLYRLLSQKLLIPYLNIEQLDLIVLTQGTADYSKFSIFALGIMPFISAYIAVEVLSLITPPLKRWRRQGNNGRKKMRLITYIFATILVSAQGYGLITFMRGLAMDDFHIMLASTLTEYLILISIYIAALFTLIFFAKKVTKHGITHGISLIIFYEIFWNAIKTLPNIIESFTGFLLLLSASLMTSILPGVVLSSLPHEIIKNVNKIIVNSEKFFITPSQISKKQIRFYY